MKLSIQDELNSNNSHEGGSLLGKKEPDNSRHFTKFLSLFIIGVLTCIYSIAEIVIALSIHSLALLTDGFHNFSDVIAIVIAYWAIKQSSVSRTDTMTYGWKRAEVLGAVMNGCFLLALCMYIVLEAIPRFITPDDAEMGDKGSWEFIGISGAGLLVNLIGTLVFAVTGHGHSHGPGGGDHGHSHGGDDHGHAHSKKAKKNVKQDEESLRLINPISIHHEEDFAHGHEHGDAHGHGHGHGDAHCETEEKHGHGQGDKPKKDKSEKHGHGHGDKPKKESHGHGHGDKPKKVSHGHGHDLGQSIVNLDNYHEPNHGHSHGHGHDDNCDDHHGHAHGDDDHHGHGHDDDDFHDPAPEKKAKFDMNIRAVFLHYLGDTVSSLCLLVAGILLHFFPYNKKDGTNTWALYIDPISSLLIVVLIVITLIPLLKGCANILLQQVPAEIDTNELKNKLEKVSGIEGVHDLHVWQLDDTMVIASVHVMILTSKIQFFESIVAGAKKILHQAGIHSSTIQPEFIHSTQSTTKCESYCAVDCEEDWCCKDESFEEDIVNYSAETSSTVQKRTSSNSK